MKKIFQYAKGLMVAMTIPTMVRIYDRKDALPMDLRQYEWKSRLLFLFAPDVNRPKFEKLYF